MSSLQCQGHFPFLVRAVLEHREQQSRDIYIDTVLGRTHAAPQDLKLDSTYVYTGSFTRAHVTGVFADACERCMFFFLFNLRGRGRYIGFWINQPGSWFLYRPSPKLMLCHGWQLCQCLYMLCPLHTIPSCPSTEAPSSASADFIPPQSDGA